MFPLDPSLPESPLAFSTGEHCLQLQTFTLTPETSCSLAPFQFLSPPWSSFPLSLKNWWLWGDLLDPLLFPVCPCVMASTARALWVPDVWLQLWPLPPSPQPGVLSKASDGNAFRDLRIKSVSEMDWVSVAGQRTSCSSWREWLPLGSSQLLTCRNLGPMLPDFPVFPEKPEIHNPVWTLSVIECWFKNVCMDQSPSENHVWVQTTCLG